MVAIAAGLASLTMCEGRRTANTADTTDNLTEGIVINNAEVFANDATAANATNATNANAATNNAQ
jgi:hypothetical protein